MGLVGRLDEMGGLMGRVDEMGGLASSAIYSMSPVSSKLPQSYFFVS